MIRHIHYFTPGSRTHLDSILLGEPLFTEPLPELALSLISLVVGKEGRVHQRILSHPPWGASVTGAIARDGGTRRVNATANVSLARLGVLRRSLLFPNLRDALLLVLVLLLIGETVLCWTGRGEQSGISHQSEATRQAYA